MKGGKSIKILTLVGRTRSRGASASGADVEFEN